MDPLLLLTGFLAAAVRVATPLLFAATGETVTERSGVINLGIEGQMLAGALAAALGASAWGPWGGLAAPRRRHRVRQPAHRPASALRSQG